MRIAAYAATAACLLTAAPIVADSDLDAAFQKAAQNQKPVLLYVSHSS